MAKPLWFVKSKRAQTSDDDETWVAGGVVPTLNAFDCGDTRATVLIFEATRVEDVRIYEDYCPTVARYWGTGGARVPYVYAIQGTVIGRSDEAGPQGKGFADDGEPMYTLDRVSGHGVAVIPIQDGREVEKHQNGTGIGNNGDPAYTLDRQQAPSIAIAFHHKQDPISGDVSPALGTTSDGMGVMAFSPSSFANYSEGMGTLKAGMTNNNSPLAVDIYNHSISETNQTLRKGNGGPDHTGVIMETSVVRRLTPTECERLQGFPDGWTEGQADSHRYKQMGNAVAVPVVQWIIGRLNGTDTPSL